MRTHQVRLGVDEAEKGEVQQEDKEEGEGGK